MTKSNCVYQELSGLHKSETLWPIQLDVKLVEKSNGRWSLLQRELQGIRLSVDDTSKPHAILELHRDERTDYRFNLSSHDPKLFAVFENNEQVDLQPLVVTASQSVAAQYLDGDYVVVSKPMPLPVQAWMEAFIGRNGELLEQRRKKRKGAGRASGK
jgi:hypothetical protein